MLDLRHLQTWIGQRAEASELLHQGLVDRLNATLGDSGVHQMIHLCLAQPMVPGAGLGPDGHPERGGFLPPVPLPRRMWAGGDLTFHAPLAVGDLVKRRSEILDVTAKQGRTGPLCFVTVEHRIFAGGTLAVTERHDIVYREITPTPLPSGAAPQGRHQAQITVDPVLLFRYSALTFNGHRIHYDRSYTVEIEQYPGLVVHGPLQATLLAGFARQILGRPLARFRFRSHAPLFDTAPVRLHADPTPDGLRLWTARPDGPLAMEAEAT